MSRRLLLDEMFSQQFAEQIGKAGIDSAAVLSHAELVSAPDEDVLKFASAAERCLVTRNNVDFIEIAQRWAIADLDHSGIILIHNSTFPNVGAPRGMITRALVRMRWPVANEVAWLTRI